VCVLQVQQDDFSRERAQLEKALADAQERIETLEQRVGKLVFLV